jgi:hypothetical protein
MYTVRGSNNLHVSHLILQISNKEIAWTRTSFQSIPLCIKHSFSLVFYNFYFNFNSFPFMYKLFDKLILVTLSKLIVQERHREGAKILTCNDAVIVFCNLLQNFPYRFGSHAIMLFWVLVDLFLIAVLNGKLGSIHIR